MQNGVVLHEVLTGAAEWAQLAVDRLRLSLAHLAQSDSLPTQLPHRLQLVGVEVVGFRLVRRMDDPVHESGGHGRGDDVVVGSDRLRTLGVHVHEAVHQVIDDVLFAPCKKL